jgi:WD40 repeat protein
MSNLPSELLHTLTGHEGPVLNVRFNPKGNYCISCGKVCMNISSWPWNTTAFSRCHESTTSACFRSSLCLDFR